MGAIVSQITSLMIIYSTVYLGADQRKHQSSASLAFVRGIHRWPVNAPHKWPVTRKSFPFNDVIMQMVLVRIVFRLVSSHNGLMEVPVFTLSFSNASLTLLMYWWNKTKRYGERYRTDYVSNDTIIHSYPKLRKNIITYVQIVDTLCIKRILL